MMGRLSERDRQLIGRAIQGVAAGDVSMIQEVVMALGEFKKTPDPSHLYEGIRELFG